MSDQLHACLDLLDRQVLDADDEPVGKVDDVELDWDGPRLRVHALLVGPHALGRRMGGRIGRWLTGAANRLSGTNEPVRIPLKAVAEIGVLIKLNVRAQDVERIHGVEHWLRDRLIGRIPGSHHASE
ncbi:MAG TPA: hypothetical protein VG709_08140 [Actinomycetota bacterium]|nr:hypothetical protein [Actinomycetota bacterium]